MGGAIIVLLLSISYALFLVFKLKSFMGSYFLILSGDNLFNAKGIELNVAGVIALWLVAIVGVIWGVVLLVRNLSNTNYSSNLKDGVRKKCPNCAEQILVDAKICKHCGSIVRYDEIDEYKGTSIPEKSESLGAFGGGGDMEFMKKVKVLNFGNCPICGAKAIQSLKKCVSCSTDLSQFRTR